MEKPIALQDLDFGHTLEKGQHPQFTRLASGFNHGTVIRSIQRRACKVGVAVPPVDPAFTLVIGGFKYQAPLGLSGHQAAALTIGRRAFVLRERIRGGEDAPIHRLRRALQEQLHRLPDRVPGEGTRRAVRGQLQRLVGVISDKRVHIHNGGRSGWVDRERTGLWGRIRHAPKRVASLNRG